MKMWKVHNDTYLLWNKIIGYSWKIVLCNMTPWWHILRFFLDGDGEPSEVKAHSHKEVTEKKLLCEVKRLRVKVWKLKKRARDDKEPHGGRGKTFALKVLKPLMKRKAYEFIKTQVRLAGRKLRGSMFSLQDEALCLSLYSASPKLYRLLGTIFNLPNRQTLQRTLRKLDYNTGFQPVVLLVDEISIKEILHYDPQKDRLDRFEELGNTTTHPNIVNHASVFMVRGLCEKSKQTIGYFSPVVRWRWLISKRLL